MTATLTFLKLDGTSSSKLQLNAAAAGVVLKNVSGNLEARNAADSADATITGSEFLASGMTGAWTLTLPTSGGTVGQVLSTDGAGTTSWIDAASGATDTTIQTDLNFGDGSTVASFTLPIGGIILSVDLVVDTSFDGTPSVSIGIAADHSLFLGSGDANLSIAAGWNTQPNIPGAGSAEPVIIYYSAGGATVGSARALITYATPL